MLSAFCVLHEVDHLRTAPPLRNLLIDILTCCPHGVRALLPTLIISVASLVCIARSSPTLHYTLLPLQAQYRTVTLFSSVAAPSRCLSRWSLRGSLAATLCFLTPPPHECHLGTGREEEMRVRENFSLKGEYGKEGRW